MGNCIQQQAVSSAGTTHDAGALQPPPAHLRRRPSAEQGASTTTQAQAQRAIFSEANASMDGLTRERRRHLIASTFTHQNFCFATKQPGRLPTLYFANGGPSQLNTTEQGGRIRQQHDEGPLVDVFIGERKHYFFENREQMRAVRSAIRENPFRTAFEAAVQGISQVPQRNSTHMEVVLTVNAQGEAGVDDYHASIGTVDLTVDLNGVDPEDIANTLLQEGAKFDFEQLRRT